MQYATTYSLAPIDAAATRSAPMVRKPMRRRQPTAFTTVQLALAGGLAIAAALAAIGIAAHGATQLKPQSSVTGTAIDVALLSLFALHHQLMQSGRGLGRWLRGASAETLLVGEFLVAGVLLGVVYAAWQPLPFVFWNVEASPWRALLWAGWGVGWLLAWRGARVAAPLRVVAAIATARHAKRAVVQLLAGAVLINFCAPQMTGGHLLFAVATTAYLGVRCVRRIGAVAATSAG